MNNTLDEIVETTYKELFVKYEKALEKHERALNNAIKVITEHDICTDTDTDYCCCGDENECERCWKEWLLKDE